MRLAIISDIHSNLEALEAVFEDLRCQDIDKVYCTGDLVGYAANPNEVINLLQQERVKCVMGNHDFACINTSGIRKMVGNAREAIDYTKKVITANHLSFLNNLPFHINENGIYLTHGLPPALFDEYINMQSAYALKNAFASFHEQIAFVGHTHLFEVVELKEHGKICKYELANDGLYLSPTSRYIISAGSIGQPRADNREAGYLIYYTDNHKVIKRTFQYPVEITIQKIIAAGLPKGNGERLRKY